MINNNNFTPAQLISLANCFQLVTNEEDAVSILLQFHHMARANPDTPHAQKYLKLLKQFKSKKVD